MENLIWFGIAACLVQSAMFSGLNLAFFSLSRLRLEAEAGTGSRTAAKVLVLRRDSNFLLTTILWGNVAINVLLTLLSNSILFGLTAFAFSTVVITLAGEIAPQAYFSRQPMKTAAFFSPLIRFYQFVLYPVAKPSAWLLDLWLGKEPIQFLRERQLRGVIEQHIDADDAEIDLVEGRGALNFLDIDEVSVANEGESIDPDSIIRLPTKIDLPILPEVASLDDEFVELVNRSDMKWTIIVDQHDYPQLILDADAFLRVALRDGGVRDAYAYCHRPIVITDPGRPLGHIIGDLRRGFADDSDAVIAKDIVLLWTETDKRVITGADLLGRLLRGIRHVPTTTTDWT